MNLCPGTEDFCHGSSNIHASHSLTHTLTHSSGPVHCTGRLRGKDRALHHPQERRGGEGRREGREQRSADEGGGGGERVNKRHPSAQV